MSGDRLFSLPTGVDSTMLDAARVCAHRFAQVHGRGLASPHRSVDLVAGGAFAAARHALYTYAYASHSRTTSLEAARIAFEREWDGFELGDSKSPKTFEQTWKLVPEYAKVFDPPNDILRPATHLVDPPYEWPFRVVLDAATLSTPYEWPRHPETGNPFEYVGRLDSVVQLEGVTLGVDDKTTSRFTAIDTWVASLQMRAQLIGYDFVLRKRIDPQSAGFVIRQGAVRKNDVEWRESPIIPFTDAVRERWLKTTHETLTRICHYAQMQDGAEAFPRVFGDACVAWSRPCSFLEACRHSDPESQLTKFIVRRWDPLAGMEMDD